MESSKLDETSPTYQVPEGNTPLESGGLSATQNTEADPTQPMVVSSTEQPMGHLNIDSSESPSQSDSPEGSSLTETQPSIVSDEALILPPDIPELPMDTPRKRRRWILWAFIGVLLLALIAGGSVYA
jgi:hypothetical protein